jgi:hypothetical protein
VLFVPLYQYLTLDDELVGSRAEDNQVKSLSMRKADREGKTAEVIADALFRVVLALLFHRRDEAQADGVSKLIESLMEGRGELSSKGLIVTADRGYGKAALLETLRDKGIGCMFVMPQHLLKCHPFVASSYFNPSRADIMESEDGDFSVDNEPNSAD